jgi:hypothetical protein
MKHRVKRLKKEAFKLNRSHYAYIKKYSKEVKFNRTLLRIMLK